MSSTTSGSMPSSSMPSSSSQISIDPEENQTLDDLFNEATPRHVSNAVTIANHYLPHVDKLQKDISLAAANKQRLHIQIQQLKDNVTKNNTFPRSFNGHFTCPATTKEDLHSTWKQISDEAKSKCFDALIANMEAAWLLDRAYF